jgi:3-hydroxyisobutyrate dehydrogenase-like beta-hydroxyacid dehydrogenase
MENETSLVERKHKILKYLEQNQTSLDTNTLKRIFNTATNTDFLLVEILKDLEEIRETARDNKTRLNVTKMLTEIYKLHHGQKIQSMNYNVNVSTDIQNAVVEAFELRQQQQK